MKSLAAAILGASLAAPAAAQTIQGVLIDPPRPTSRDRVELTVVGTQHPECPFTWSQPKFDPFYQTFILRTAVPKCGSPLPAEVELRKTFEIGPLVPGLYFVQTSLEGLPFGSRFEVFEVTEPTTVLTLGGPPASPTDTAITFEPLRPTTLDPVQITVTVMSGDDPKLQFLGVQDRSIVFEYISYVYPSGDFPPPFVPWTAKAKFGPLKAGVYTIEGREDGLRSFQRSLEVVEPKPQLVLQADESSYFTVAVDFVPPKGSNLRGTAYGVPLTRQSGYFWFFEPDNIEITIKILDGRPVNGRWWVFLSSLTDLKFTATVTQCPANPESGVPCFTKAYESSQGVNKNIIDVNFQGF